METKFGVDPAAKIGQAHLEELEEERLAALADRMRPEATRLHVIGSSAAAETVKLETVKINGRAIVSRTISGAELV